MPTLHSNSSVLVKDPYRYMDNLYNILNEKIDNLELEVEEVEEELESNVTFMLNDREITVNNVDPELSLINYLRDTLHLTGTKVNCNQGFCGVCTVIITHKNSSGEYRTESVNSCLLKVVNLNGRAINTIESIRSDKDIADNKLHPIQQYFWKLGALQCGYCTTGFEMKILSSVQSKDTLPTFNTIENQLSGNICRCTGYRPIIEAYKVLLIAIAENPVNGVSQSDVVGNVNKAIYDDEYDHLLNKWQIGKSHGLPLYDLNNNNINTSEIKQFLDKSTLTSTKLFVSEVYDNYKYYVPANLEGLDKILLDVNTGSDHLKSIYLVNEQTSLGVPSFTEILHKFPIVINIGNISELYQSSVSETQVTLGAGLEQNRVQELLNSTNNQMFLEIAKNIEYIAGSSVRNLGSFIGSLMMTIKYGYRGDWATMLSGADAKFTYAVYDSRVCTPENCCGGPCRKVIKSNRTYSQLVTDFKNSELLLVHTMTITNSSSSTVYRYQRSASRLLNAQSYGNMAIKATKNGTSYTNLLIAVGAVSDDGVQFKNLSGPYSASNISSLLSQFNFIIKDQYKFVDVPSSSETVLNMLKGFAVKFITDAIDIKETSVTTHGKQRYDGGLTSDLTADYNIYNLIPKGQPDASDRHLLAKAGALTQWADNTATEGDKLYRFDDYFANRDQVSDYLPDGQTLESIGYPKPQRDTRARVLGECVYSSEHPIDAYSSELITTNCASGTIDLNTPENQALLNKFRNFNGVEAVIVNDVWFTENIGNYLEHNYYKFTDGFFDTINFFNSNFYNVLLNLPTTSQFVSGFGATSNKLTLDKTIRYYGQIFGIVIAKNLTIARYVAEQLTNGLVHTKTTPDLAILNDEGKFIPHDVLSDKNTASRAYKNVFGTITGMAAGLENQVENNPNAESLVPPDTTFIGGTPGQVPAINPLTGSRYPYGFYVNNTDQTTEIVPNFENEYKQGSFYTNPNSYFGQTALATKVGQNETFLKYIPGTSPPEPVPYPPNKWLSDINPSTGEPNVNGIFENSDLGDYSGTIKINSQFAGPMEGQAFTLVYETGRVLKCYINTQDSFPFRLLNQVLNNLLPQFKTAFYDKNGNFIASDIETVIEVQNLASGGSFGGKFWYANYRQIELLVLSAILTRKPIRHLEYWKYNEGTLVGRPIYQNNVSLSVDSSTKLIKSVLSDQYSLLNKDSGNKAFNGLAYSIYTFKDQIDFEWANRWSAVELNIGDCQWQRGIMDTEAYAFSSAVFSKASALLREPYHRLFIKHLNQADELNDRLDPAKQKPNVQGFKGVFTQRENVFLELQTAIIKNIHKQRGTPTPNISTKTDVINAFDDIYDKEITQFNKTSKTRKRGMSFGAVSYTVLQFVASGYICKMHINYNSHIALDIPVIDQGTGSFQNAIDVVAEYLKVDTTLIHQVSSSNTFLNTGMIHAGSVGRVGVPRAANAAAQKFMASMLSRYPVNPYYSGLLQAFYPTAVLPYPPVNALTERWYQYPEPLVARNNPDPPNNPVDRSVNALVTPWLAAFGLSPVPMGGGKYKIDLRYLSGDQLTELYDYVFASLNYSALIHDPFGAAPKPLAEMANIPGPDLHRELIARTLEFEYSPVFVSPGSNPAFPTGAILPGKNGWAQDTQFFADLVKNTDGIYTNPVTKSDMMNRWPMIVAYQAMAIRIEDRGSFEYSLTLGKGLAIDGGINTGEFPGELFGICLGGNKLDNSDPNSYNGHAQFIYNGAINGYFAGNTQNLCTVEANVHDTPTTKIIRPNLDTGISSQLDGFAYYSTQTASYNLSEIDVLTGEWVSKHSEVTINTDRAINPLADFTQGEGGFEFGVGFSTMENSSNFIDGGEQDGRRLLNGHYNYKMPLSRTTSEVFNCTLLNVTDAFRPGYTGKTCGEITTVMGNVVASSLRDAIRNFREEIYDLTESEPTIPNPFASDRQTSNRNSCNYMDDLCQTPVIKIKKYTALPDNVLEYYMNN